MAFKQEQLDEIKDIAKEAMQEVFNERFDALLKERSNDMFGEGILKVKSDMHFDDNLILILSQKNGLKIGSGTGEKIAFFGVTPVVQQATISDPSGGMTIDSQARSAINDLIDRLQAFGLIA